MRKLTAIIILILIITMAFLFINKQTKNKSELLSATDWEKLRLENINNSNYIVIDVRTSEEFKDNGILGAINIDYYNPSFKKNVMALDLDKKYLIYCRSGYRSGNAAKIFNKLKIGSVYDLDGGMIEYSKLKH